MKPRLPEHPFAIAFMLALVGFFFQLSAVRWMSAYPHLLWYAFAAHSIFVFAIFCFLLRLSLRFEEAYEESEVARERVAESDRMKKDFMTSMSHEIRGPLSAVLGFTDLLLDPKVPQEEKQEYRERLKSNAEELTHLVTDLVDVAEVDAYGVKHERVVLADLIRKAYEVFSPQAEEKGLKLQFQLRGSIPAFVESDSEKLMQVLRHVIGNAIRYSDHGLIKTTFTASKTAAGRREVAVIVTDQGPGIASDVKQKLFKTFASNEETSKSKTHGGTGLGLTIARRLARGLGGDVKLAKTNRKGSTFVMTFDGGPVDKEHELLDHLVVASCPGPQFSPDDPHALDGIKVLVVDDSPDAALLVSRMLKMVGAQVDIADRGEAGVERASRDPYDVVLMDIQMPEMDGNEAIRRLRSKGFRKPIVALSAHAMKEDQTEAERAGANEYLTKPVSRHALMEMVGRFATLSRSRLRGGEEYPSGVRI